ncbi:hypothetical protein [Streptomyces sp. NPDC002599]|uniref:radical SAM protein n=1 Tax=Streptomyces sp. NPDC002599 TaxID=3154421 RepID=UPI0033337934
MTAVLETPTHTGPASVKFLELEITGRCQLTCSSHCYAQAGPTKGHGSMTGDDWRRVIDEAATLGVETVQFIGGCRCRDRVPCRSCRFGRRRLLRPVSR